MRRSVINRLMREAKDLFSEHRFALPPFGHWPPDAWRADPETSRYCRTHQMGWDVTDFGGGSFEIRGLLLFCLRNGLQGVAQERPYAEKLLVVREGQETPFHWHKVKMEDIIVRGGGTLVIEAYETTADGGPSDEPFAVLLDGQRQVFLPREPIHLIPGQSITVHRELVHRFYGAAGGGIVLVGEVSQVNDDLVDNYFPEPVGRFATIEEDEAPLHLLWNELP